MKKCKQCKKTKPLSEYYRYTDGYIFGKCKNCCIEKAKTWNAENPRKYKAAIDRYNKSPKGRKWKSDWWKTKGRVLDVKRNQTEERKEFYRNRAKKRFRKNPEYYRLKFRAQRAGARVEVIRQVFDRDKCCQLCGSNLDLQIDHIFPESLGGQGTLFNLQLLCRDCNLFKRDHLFLPGGGMMIVSADLKRRLVGEGANSHPES